MTTTLSPPTAVDRTPTATVDRRRALITGAGRPRSSERDVVGAEGARP